jgi:integrase/recombinase XerD
LWPRTFCTLLALLWCTGLRISEAMGLRFEDMKDDGLVIRRSKFNKTRLVPLHDTVVAELDRYVACRRRVGGATDRIFVSLQGRPLEYTTLRKTFRSIVRAAGLEQPGSLVPRLHSLRHSFAVRALLACPDGRDHIARHTLALSTYLGHTCVADTYWYFEATPELMTDVAARCEHFMDGGAS